jgi:hypothetical protein
MTIQIGINSCISVANANDYFASRLRNSAWINASDADKTSALIAATREIDRLSFVGYVTSQSQSLAWPRSSVREREGRIIDSNATPTAITNATCEWALTLLSAEHTDTPAIKTKRVGDLAITYASSQPDMVPTAVRRELQQFLRSAKNSAPLVF